jgi:hypothetical protein
MTNIDDVTQMMKTPTGDVELAEAKTATAVPNDLTKQESYSTGEGKDDTAVVAEEAAAAAGNSDSIINNKSEKSPTLSDSMMYDDVDMIVDERSGRSINISATLTPCTYSIIFVTRVGSWSFWYAIFVFLFQITIAALTLADLVDWDARNNGDPNTLAVPANVSGPVRIAGYMCMVLAVVYFTDLVS